MSRKKIEPVVPGTSSLLDPIQEGDEQEECVMQSELEAIREELSTRINNGIIVQRKANAKGVYRCLFYHNGCTSSQFPTNRSMLEHAHECINGAFSFCKVTGCKIASGRMMGLVRNFVEHARKHHSLNSVQASSDHAMHIVFDKDLLNPPADGYSLKLIRTMSFVQKDHKFSVLFTVAVTEGDCPSRRIMIVPMVYSEEKDECNDLVEISCTLRGRNRKPVQPIAFPGFSVENPNPTAYLYALKSSREFLAAMKNMDGLLTFSMSSLMENGIYITSPNSPSLFLDLYLNGVRCELWGDSIFPPLPVAFSWSELAINERVRKTMTDSGEVVPYPESRILLPQMRSQADIVIEADKSDVVDNAITTGILEYIFGLEPRDMDNPKPVLAVVVYPTVAMISKYRREWKKRAQGLNISVFSFDRKSMLSTEQLETHGADVLLITPTLWNEVVCGANERYRETLTSQVRYVYFHHMHKYCFKEVQEKLKECIAAIPIDANGTIRIGFLQMMSDKVFSSSRPQLFNLGWNEFRLGRNPAVVLTSMRLEVIKYNSTDSKVASVVRNIAEGGSMRWLVLVMKGSDSIADCTALIRKLRSNIPPRRLTYISLQDVTSIDKKAELEAEVFGLHNFWDPFMERKDAVMVGPSFLLDHSQAKSCDGVIIFTDPAHVADVIRIQRIARLSNGEQKRIITFLKRN